MHGLIGTTVGLTATVWLTHTSIMGHERDFAVMQEAVEHYETAAKALRYIFDKADNDDWLNAPVISFVKALVIIARRASASSQRSENSGDVLKRAGAEIRSIRATAFRHSKVRPCEES
jgi:hypothetical protein